MISKEISRAIRMLRSLPKTVYFNFHYLKFSQAVKLPIWISHKVSLVGLKGKVDIGRCATGVIQIGFDRTGSFDENSKSVWDVSGTVKFNGMTRIGPGIKLIVEGELEFGDNFQAGMGTSIYCINKIGFGSGCLLSWDVTLMDHDFHEIRDMSGNVINQSRPISFGKNVWIGCKSTIFKGAGSNDDCVIAAGSLLNKRLDVNGSIIGGMPVRVLREDIHWNP